MKPLFSIVATILVISTNALPESIADVKELPQTKEPIVEAEASDAQARVERCTNCPGPKLIKNTFLAPLTQLPNAEVHTQQSFEGCSSDKGCAGIKVKDGTVIEKFGNVDSFRQAAASNAGNEFTFHAAGTFDNNLLGLNQPFWWMNQNSPFKNGGNIENSFSKSSSSSFSTSGNGGIDINANPFLNGDISKLAVGFTGGAASEGKPSTFQSSSFESSSYSTSNKEVDLAKNPFLNGGFNSQFGQGFGNGQSVNQFEQGSFGQFGASASGNKFGYTGSSPSPFTAPGSNVNLIQNSQKASEFDFESQSQTQQTQNIDEAFKHTGNVNAHEHTGGDLQQTCAGQGYACVHKAQCNNGVVNSNGGNLLQANTKKQYCNIRTEICCRIEVSSLAGAGGLQGSLGVGSGTYSGSNSQGSGLFVSQSGNSQNGFNSVSQTGSGQSASGQSASGQSGSGQSGSGTSGFGQSGQGFTQTSQSSFNSVSQTEQNGQGFAQNGQSGKGQNGFGASGTVGFGANKNFGSQGNQNTFGSGFETQESSSSFNGFGSTVNPINTNRFSGNSGNVNEVFKSTSQSNFIETDSFSAGSENSGIYRPGQPGSGLKPGIPYLPPVDSSTSATNLITSTFATQRPFSTPRPTTPRPIKPYVPSTQAPGYLPPEGESSNTKETRLPSPKPTYDEGQIILDETRQPIRPPVKRPVNPVPAPNEIPAGCAAALKCTPIEYCTSEGVISNTTVVLTRDQEAYRVPLTDCKDIESGRIGKCCRDPYYTDPWPTNQLGQWVPGVFGGNDGQYVPDSRGSPNNNVRPVTVRPPVTGSIYKDNFQQPKPTTPTFGPNSITPGFPSSTPVYQGTKGGQGQYSVAGQGQYTVGGQGQYTVGGQGQYSTAGQGIGTQFGQGSQVTQTTSSFGQSNKRVTQGQGVGVTQGQGIGVTQGQGIGITQGQGVGIIQGQGSYSQGGKGQFDSQVQAGQNVFTQTQAVSQNQGSGIIRGQGQTVTQGQGQIVSQGAGFGISQGQGQGVSQGSGFGISQGQGQVVSQGQGQAVSQGSGFGIIQGQGQGVTQGSGFGISQGQGQTVSQGSGFGVSQGSGFGVSQGSGFGVSQGSGIGVTQGGGFNVVREQGQSVTQQGTRGQTTQGIGRGQGQTGNGVGIAVSQGSQTSQFQGTGQSVNRGQGQFGSQAELSVSRGAGFGVAGSSTGQSVNRGESQFTSQTSQSVSRGQGQLGSQGSVGQGAGFGISAGLGGTQGVSRGESQFSSQATSVSRGQGQSGNQGSIGQTGFGIPAGIGGAAQGINREESQFSSQATSVSRGQGQFGGQGANRQEAGFGISAGLGGGVNREESQFSSQSTSVSRGQGQTGNQGANGQGGFGILAGIGGGAQGVNREESQFSSQSTSVSRGQGQTGNQGAIGQGGFGISVGLGGGAQGVNREESQFSSQSTSVSRGQGQTGNQGANGQGGFGILAGIGGGAQGVNREESQFSSQSTSVSRGQGQTGNQGAIGQGGFGISAGIGGGAQSVNRGESQFSSQATSVSRGQGQFGGQETVGQGAGFGFSAGIEGAQGVSRGENQFAGQGASQNGFGISTAHGTNRAHHGAGHSATQGAGFEISTGQAQGTQGIGFGVSIGGVGGEIDFGVAQGTQRGSQGFGIGQGNQGNQVEFGIGTGFNQGIDFGLGEGIEFGLVRGQGQKLTKGKRSDEIEEKINGNGVGVENEYSESVQRVFLQQYSAGGQCGLLNPQKPYGNRNDQEADFAEIPWQAMVLLQTNRSLLCGGIITRPDVVITAAQCVDGLEARNVLIKGGEWKLGIDDEPLPYQIVQVKTILRHPLYRPGLFINDVAILVLSENLRLAKNIYPICLPGSKDTLDAFYNGAGECIVSGWGKSVLQSHQKGSIIHSLNVSLLNPGECQAKLSQDYPHLLETYDQDSCACGEPTNPVNNICKVDVGSALACTTGDGHYVLRGVYSWDSGCQVGNQIAGFYKFDLEWYEWAIGLIESVRYGQYATGSKITNTFSGQINSGIKTSQFGIKGQNSQIKGGNFGFGSQTKGGEFGLGQGQIKGSGEFGLGQVGLGQVGQIGQVGQFSQFGSSKYTDSNGNLNFGSEIKGPLTNTFSATYTEKKVFQSEPKFVSYTTKPEIVTFTTKPEIFTYTTKPKLVTYTTKPEIVTFTTKPEIFTYTTKPKIVSYTTKPQIIRYETSGSGTNPQFVAPDVTFNPSFSEVVGHKHSGTCKCLEGK